MITPTPEKPKKRTHAQPEGNIQMDCFSWFWNEYPQYRGLLFHVPNENDRSKYESRQQQMVSGARRRMLGVVPGVADLVGLIPSREHHGFCAECKTSTGRQSQSQVEWEKRVSSMGYRYFIFRSLEDFKTEIQKYLDNGKTEQENVSHTD